MASRKPRGVELKPEDIPELEALVRIGTGRPRGGMPPIFDGRPRCCVAWNAGFWCSAGMQSPPLSAGAGGANPPAAPRPERTTRVGVYSPRYGSSPGWVNRA